MIRCYQNIRFNVFYVFDSYKKYDTCLAVYTIKIKGLKNIMLILNWQMNIQMSSVKNQNKYMSMKLYCLGLLHAYGKP